ncbi:Beta-D-glucosyl crocetin beta-1,6-glucosyltransferase [Camellia lanceoleosa]|uniref:Beta-D-glucosyl crocetin beta-1,6-glucosyltransferase n=1 Tax=Camellia lanceoleosa TaxID=1840588 RepID=A0ACC0GBL1_9ERIC|nr:Beta-D-glucosyl crocetin beta-1,6-glucosyltransferase [Camellia lanceoleosa]
MGMMGSLPPPHGYFVPDIVVAALTGVVTGWCVGPLIPVLGHWKAGLPLWLRPYEVLVTSSYTALVETIPDTASLHSMRKIEVFMFPWLAHGHISPFLELAKTLSSRNFMVYLCSTAVNLSCIKRRLTENDADSIQLVELPVPTLPGLPPNCHTTKNLPPHLMPTLKKAFDWSSHNFSKILKTLKPDLLIYDTIQPWAPIIASKHDIPAVVFISTSATMTSYMFDRYNNPGTDFVIRYEYV